MKVILCLAIVGLLSFSLYADTYSATRRYTHSTGRYERVFSTNGSSYESRFHAPARRQSYPVISRPNIFQGRNYSNGWQSRRNIFGGQTYHQRFNGK